MPRLVTFNTWKCDGEYGSRLPAMAAACGELDADVLCLQECFHSVDGQWNTAHTLADRLGLDYRLLSYRRKTRQVDGGLLDSFSGLAVLSRLPIAGEREIAVPVHPADGERQAQEVVVTLAGKSLRLVNLHLSHLPGAVMLRRQQLSAILATLQADEALPALLCGDFNAPLTQFEVPGLLAPAGPLQDTWTLGGGTWPRTPTVQTALRQRGLEAASGVLDHILVLQGARRALRFRAASTVLQSETGRILSDHVGVAVDFEWL